MSKITEGDWKICHIYTAHPHGRDWRSIVGVVEPDCYERTRDGITEFYSGVRIKEADANLIIASKDLLAACKLARAELAWLIEQTKARTNGSVDIALQAVTAAITKAEAPCTTA